MAIEISELTTNLFKENILIGFSKTLALLECINLYNYIGGITKSKPYN